MNFTSGNIELSYQKINTNFLPRYQSSNVNAFDDWSLPVQTSDRKSIQSIQLTEIGLFGLVRKPRPGVPQHLHTGIDIMRPSENYVNEPVYPAAVGEVISVRNDGPFAQIIIAHQLEGEPKAWTVFEHVAGILVAPGDEVNPFVPIARFMNQEELNQFGWQFNHLHFEVMRVEPVPFTPSAEHPNRFYTTYWMDCRNEKALNEMYHDPMRWLGQQWEH